jgi:hypothetical protein
MVNNVLQLRAYLLRPSFLFLLIALSSTLQAQKISKYYTSTKQDNGILYFVEPKHEFKNKRKNAEFSYDLTYLSSHDSMVFNFSLIYDKIRSIDSITFFQNNIRLKSKTTNIYTEAYKNAWEHRYSARFLLNDLAGLYKPKEMTSISLYCKNEVINLEMKKRKWKKQSGILSKIFEMIKANKRNR